MEQRQLEGKSSMSKTDGALALKEEVEILWEREIPRVRALNAKSLHPEIIRLAKIGGCKPNKGRVRLVGIPSDQIFEAGHNLSLQEMFEWGSDNGYAPSTLFDAVALRKVWQTQPEELIVFMGMVPIRDGLSPTIISLSNADSRLIIKPLPVHKPTRQFLITHPKRVIVFRLPELGE